MKHAFNITLLGTLLAIVLASSVHAESTTTRMVSGVEHVVQPTVKKIIRKAEKNPNIQRQAVKSWVAKEAESVTKKEISATVNQGNRVLSRAEEKGFVAGGFKKDKKLSNRNLLKARGPNEKQRILESPREAHLRNADDPRLKNTINNLYRPGARIGNGSTADAVRHERATGELLSPNGHTQKLIDRRAQLMRMRKNPNMSAGDQRIIRDLLKDAQDALSN